MKFRLLIDFEVLDIALKLPAREQHRLFVRFSEIQMFPGNFSNFMEVDGEDRVLHVCLFDGFYIKYWIDDADRHIKILQILENE